MHEEYFSYTCSSCGNQLLGMPEWSGRTIACPNCGTSIIIQKDETEKVAQPNITAPVSGSASPVKPIVHVLTAAVQNAQPPQMTNQKIKFKHQEVQNTGTNNAPSQPVTTELHELKCQVCFQEYSAALPGCPYCREKKLIKLNRIFSNIIMRLVIPAIALLSLAYGVFSHIRWKSNDRMYEEMLAISLEADRAEEVLENITFHDLESMDQDMLNQNIQPRELPKFSFADSVLLDAVNDAETRRIESWKKIKDKFDRYTKYKKLATK